MVIEPLPAAWTGACAKRKGFQLSSQYIGKQHTLISRATFGKLISYHSGVNTVKVLDDEQRMQHKPPAQSQRKIRGDMLKPPSLESHPFFREQHYLDTEDFQLKPLL